MCDDVTAGRGRAVARPAPGSGAVDAIRLASVDEVQITALVDKLYDVLLVGDEYAR